MRLDEYIRCDALGLAALVKNGDISPRELAQTAARAMDAFNPSVNAVVETYGDRIDGLDERSLGDGPFRGVPFLMKDVFGHEAGRRMEFGSRLCRGMVTPQDSYFCELLKASGLNIIGRSAAPEYSMAGTTETALYGNTSTPWKHGYSAGGSSGGAMAAVVAGIVPIAQGSDIAGSIRIPASFCGGIGLKPSRGRVSFGPNVDENGYGLGQNFVQAKSIRDVAAMLDCVSIPQVGDPFVIPKPLETYARMAGMKPPRLRIGWSADPLMGVATDREVAAAVERTATTLADMGHDVTQESPVFDGIGTMRAMIDVWFFGFDLRLESYSKRTGLPIGEETLEPVVRHIYAHACAMKPAQFLAAMAAINTARRSLGRFYEKYDLWLSPTTPNVAEPWGRYNLSRADVTIENIVEALYAPVCSYTLPHNVTGTPAISLPLARHSSGLPIGVQIGARPAHEHVLMQVAMALEAAAPWPTVRP